MGYTIYWETKEGKKITKEEVVKCVEAIRDLIKEYKKIVKIDFKQKEANNKYNINFNGIGNDEHETFAFYSNYKDDVKEEIIEALENKNKTEYHTIINGVLKFCCCKTARKPYDKVVKLALMKIQEITNNKFKVTCDDGYWYEKDGVYKSNYIQPNNPNTEGKEVRGHKITDNLDDLSFSYDWE